MSWLHRVDAVFSTYQADSDISRIRRGELRGRDAASEVAEVLDLCEQIADRNRTGTSARTWTARLDPTGLVKGWAIEARQPHSARRTAAATTPSTAAGISNWPAKPHRVGRGGVGISDPTDRTVGC